MKCSVVVTVDNECPMLVRNAKNALVSPVISPSRMLQQSLPTRNDSSLQSSNPESRSNWFRAWRRAI
jgi:hypothetical protein